MNSKNEFNKINIKNRTCYCFDDLIRVIDVDFNNILLDKKSYKYLLIYNISYKTNMGEKPLRIRFDKIDEFIKIYNGIRYLVLLFSIIL